jgi:hypothetical protein
VVLLQELTHIKLSMPPLTWKGKTYGDKRGGPVRWVGKSASHTVQGACCAPLQSSGTLKPGSALAIARWKAGRPPTRFR